MFVFELPVLMRALLGPPRASMVPLFNALHARWNHCEIWSPMWIDPETLHNWLLEHVYIPSFYAPAMLRMPEPKQNHLRAYKKWLNELIIPSSMATNDTPPMKVRQHIQLAVLRTHEAAAVFPAYIPTLVSYAIDTEQQLWNPTVKRPKRQARSSSLTPPSQGSMTAGEKRTPILPTTSDE